MALRHPVSEEDHIQGNPLAPVVLLEYGDYQCPHCGRAYPIIKRVQDQLKEKLKFAFRNFPLAEAHPMATMAAIASEAASRQNKFWEMHDLLFENQRHLNKSAIFRYAGSILPDMVKFDSDLNDPILAKKVEADFYGGMRSGVNATPSFFINGEKMEQSWEGDGILNYLKGRFPELSL